MMKFLKIALIGLGIWILYFTVKGVGVENIVAQIAMAKWWLVPLLLLYFPVYYFFTLAWHFAFPRMDTVRVPILDLLWIRIIGETLNVVIPFTASFGGEPVKAELLRGRHGVRIEDAYASILIVYTTFWISLNLFVMGGVAATMGTMPLSPFLFHSVVAFLVCLGALAALLMVGLYFGIFGQVYLAGQHWGWWGKNDADGAAKFLRLDADIRNFYIKHPDRFMTSVFFSTLGWLAGAAEVWLIAHILGIEITWAQAWLFEVLFQVLRIITFFIPASVGAQEGGIVVILTQFGYTQPAAVAFALIRRLREIVWLSFGLGLFAVLREKKTT